MSTPVAENKPAEEQVSKEETSAATSEEVQIKEEKEATIEPSSAPESTTAAAAEQTSAMEVDSTKTETTTEATTGTESKPEDKANGSTSDAKPKADKQLRLNGAARKRFRWLLDQGYSRDEAAQLAKEPLKTKELRDRFNADTNKADNASLKVGEELKNFSGAAKKRFRWLLRNGYTGKQALKLAREPMTTIASKRNLSSSDGPPSKVLRQISDAAGGIVMAVAAKDYPSTFLTNKQTNDVKSAVLKEVVQQKDSDLKPRFESCTHVKGYLRVHCSDHETRQWLQRVVNKLTILEGVSLKVVSEKNLVKGDIYSATFTDSRGDTNEAILEFVESQNDGINVSKWKIINRKELQNKNSIELMFSVDSTSSKTIQNLDCELNYKFNKVKLRKQINMTENPQTVANNNVRMTRNLGAPQNSRRTFNQPRSTSSSFVPIWDSNLPQKRVGNNSNQLDSSRNSYNSGTGWSNALNSFGLGARGGGSFGSNNGGNKSFGNGTFGNSGGSNGRSSSRSNSFGGSNSRSNSSYGGSNNNSFGMSGGRSGNQSNNNRPFDLVDSLYDQLRLIGNSGNSDSNGYGSTRRSGGNNSSVGNYQQGRNTSSNSSSGRSGSGYGNRNFFTTTRTGFF